jgi:O-antigen/teichoic acid export membrane protein
VDSQVSLWQSLEDVPRDRNELPHTQSTMSQARVYLRNLTANWVGYGANLLVLFFMSPFVVHSLGDVNYGVWSLMMSLTGYLGLVELGTRAGIGRFINYYIGKEDAPSVNAVMSTGMAIFLVTGGMLLVASGAMAFALPWIFPKIPAELVPTARIVCVLIGANLCLGFVSAPFRQLLEALDRFELSNGLDLLVLAVRTGGTVVALVAGYGLLMLAVVQVAGSILGQVCVHLVARRVFPCLTVSAALVSRARFRELFGFSVWAFIGGVGRRLLYSADTIVVAIVFEPKWITYYAIGGMLLIKARELITQATSVFAPRMIHDCARKDWSALRSSFRRAANLVMGVGILLLDGMIVFGKEFIILWMGPKFEVSYTILAILATSSFFAVAFAITGPVYYGLNRVRLFAMLTLGQGLSNLALTLFCVLALGMGIEGVAWGTFYPRILFSILVGFIAMRWIGISLGRFLSSTGMRWTLLAGAFFLVCVGIDSWHLDARWASLFLKALAATLAYLPLIWIFLLDGGTKASIKNKALIYAVYPTLRRLGTAVQRRAGAETVLVLGDSHALVFLHPALWLRFPLKLFEVCSVGGATASGLENPNSKTQSYAIFAQALQRHKGCRRIIITLGEVDTGFVIWYRAQKYGSPVRKMFSEAVARYARFLEHSRNFGDVVVISAPLPTIRDGQQGTVANLRKEVKATQRERTELALEFNSTMERFCRENRICYVALDRDSLGTDGLVAKRLLSKDSRDHHYDQRAYATLIAVHLRNVL